MKGQIFISYRREDSAHAAGRLYDRLRQHFGKDRIFMDIDTIELGVDFARRIEDAVSLCDVVLVLIGKDWLHVGDSEGRMRLDDHDDFVRLEISTALERDIYVIPVLIDGATMPSENELPDVLTMLARRNGIPVDHVRFDRDVDKLIESLDDTVKRISKARKVKQTASSPMPKPKCQWVVGVVAFLVLAGILLYGLPKIRQTSQTNEDVYDNFASQEYDGSFDRILWDSFGEELGKIYQEKGILAISHEMGSRAEKIGLNARLYQQYEIAVPTYFEAVMSLEQPRQLDAIGQGQLSFDIFSNAVSKDFAGCKLEYGEVAAQYICYFISMGDDTLFHTGVGSVAYGQWSTFRIEVDPNTMTFAYFVDGRKVGTFAPQNVADLSSASYYLSLGINGSHAGTFTGYVDAIKIGAIDQ